MIRKKTVNIMWMIFLLILTGQTISAKPKSIKVHPYVPFTIPETGPGGEAYPSHVRNDVASARFNVKVADIRVAAIRYDNTGFGNQGHNMDVARFASNSRSPEIEINVTGDDEISSVTIHPVRFYPQEKLKISPDKKTVIFGRRTTLRHCHHQRRRPTGYLYLQPTAYTDKRSLGRLGGTSFIGKS